MSQSNIDKSFLLHTLELAKIKRGFCAPNPSVGALIVNAKNKIIAKGFHEGAGFDHAEIAALKCLPSDASPHTLYVTLEPCCHFGKTPPCIEAIIQAKIERVVYGFKDPNPKMNGKGERILQSAGILCEQKSLSEIDAFYESYHHWQQTQTPFVTAKIALTLNGKIAGKEGARVQLTGKEIGEYTHALRKKSDAILTTIDTIIQDDPQLNARIEHKIFSKPIYILDSRIRLPQHAKILDTAQSITIFHAKEVDSLLKKAWQSRNIRFIEVASHPKGLDLRQVIAEIGRDGIHDLWIEAGGKCYSAFIENRLVKKALIYVSPKWISAGLTAFSEDIFFHMEGQSIHWKQYGKDVLCEIHFSVIPCYGEIPLNGFSSSRERQ